MARSGEHAHVPAGLGDEHFGCLAGEPGDAHQQFPGGAKGGHRFLDAAAIRAALGTPVLRIEHTGSTSVPGLAAKPVIDILLIVPDTADEVAYVPALERVGYRLRIREPDWYEHGCLVRRVEDGAPYDVNLHVLSPDRGAVEIERILAFRDWLSSHHEDRMYYERTKRELAQRQWKCVQHYANAKSEVVEAILARAPPRRIT